MMKNSCRCLAALGALAFLTMPARADISAEGVVLEAHDGGPRVCVVLRHRDHTAADNITRGASFVTLYARSGPKDDWHQVREWEEPSATDHGAQYSETVLTENSDVLKNLQGSIWQARVVVENPLEPADQKIFTPTWEWATR